MTTTLGEDRHKISDLGELADFVNGLLEKGTHPGTPISINADYSEFSGGGVMARINLHDGNEDELIVDFLTDGDD